jgi:hypothetical protein
MRALFIFLILFLQSFTYTVGNVVGIDFASDSLKIAIVKPGNPLEIGNFHLICLKIWLSIIIFLCSDELSVEAENSLKYLFQ